MLFGGVFQNEMEAPDAGWPGATGRGWQLRRRTAHAPDTPLLGRLHEPRRATSGGRRRLHGRGGGGTVSTLWRCATGAAAASTCGRCVCTRLVATLSAAEWRSVGACEGADGQSETDGHF